MGRLSTTECTYLPTYLPGGSGQWNPCNALPHCPGGSGQCSSCNTLPHCLGAVGSAIPAMHCRTAWGQWAADLQQSTAALPGGSGQCNSCNALPHYLGAVESATPAMHCPTAWGSVDSATPVIHCRTIWGQWTVQLLRRTAPLPRGSGQCNSCNTLPHRLEAVRQRNSCNALPHSLGAVGSGTPAMHCLTTWGQWRVQPLQCTAPLPGGSGQCNSCDTLPHYLGAVDSATPATHCPTAWGQWTVQLLRRTAPLPGGSGQCNSFNTLPHRLGAVRQRNSCNALPHCLGAAGSATPAMHCLTASGLWAAQLVQRTASLPGSSGQCNSCNALPHCLGAAGSATLAMGGRSVLQGLWGCTTRRTSKMGSPTQKVVGASFRAYGRPSSSENRAHRPGGGRGVQPRGWSEPPARPMGSQHLPRTGRTGLGGRGVLPRGWPEYYSGPTGRRHLRRTGRTGLGGTGGAAQGVFGASYKARAEPSSSNIGAHRPGGDRESSPGGGRSLLQGPWGAIIFQ